MQRYTKIYLISLLLFGGGILATLNIGNTEYIVNSLAITPVQQADFFQNSNQYISKTAFSYIGTFTYSNNCNYEYCSYFWSFIF